MAELVEEDATLASHGVLLAISLALSLAAACVTAEDDVPIDDTQQAVSDVCDSWYCGTSCPDRQTCDGGAYGLSCSDPALGTCVMTYGPYTGDYCWGLYAQGTNYGNMGDRPDLMISTFEAFVETQPPSRGREACRRSTAGTGGAQALCSGTDREERRGAVR